jgi:hypothetical protein
MEERDAAASVSIPREKLKHLLIGDRFLVL